MRKLVIIILMFAPHFIIGQNFILYKGDTINRFIKDSIKEGRWIEFKNGKPLGEGFYESNKRVGEWVNYFEDGATIRMKLSYYGGEANGVAMIYDTLGNLKEAGTWLNHRWVGTYELFYDNGGIRQAFTFNYSGKREGVSKFYYRNGIIQKLEIHKDGIEQMEVLCDSIGHREKVNIENLLIGKNEELYTKFLDEIIISENIKIWRMRDLNEIKLDSAREKIENEAKDKKQTFIRNLIIGGLAVMGLIAFLSYRSFRRKKKDNYVINDQKQLLEERQKEIIDSIHYAKRIQQSLLPTEKYIEKNINRLRKK